MKRHHSGSISTRTKATLQVAAAAIMATIGLVLLVGALAPTEKPSARIDRICREMYADDGEAAVVNCKYRQTIRIGLGLVAARERAADRAVGD